MHAESNKLTFRLLRRGGWAAVATIMVVSLVPGEMRPTLFANQLEHYAAYCVAAILLGFGYLRRKQPATIAVLLTLLAATLEIAQLWVPGRMSRIADFAAGALGAWSGTGLALLSWWGFMRTIRPRKSS
jgi:VanZ family protein